MLSRGYRPSHKLDMSYILNRDDTVRHDPMDIEHTSSPSGNSRRSSPNHTPHDTERRYICPSCSFAFRSKGDMAKHDRSVHQGIKKHICPQCGAKFAEKGNLTKHMKRHEGIREHHCTYSNCNATFVLKDGLNRHLKSVHKKDDLAAASKSSNGSASFKLHRQSSHYHSSSHPLK